MSDALRPPDHRQLLAVWELTLRCNLACRHCGSRAGHARPVELSTAQALDLVDQLADLQCDEVALIGGEVYLRHDWERIARRIVDRGMLCTMQTGARGLRASLARRIADAGIALVGVSVDGTQASHDSLRGRVGSWQNCMTALAALRAAGVVISVNTQVNRLTAATLPALYDRLQEELVRAWQVQLTVPMGNAADDPSLLLQPVELLDVFPLLARIARRATAEGMRFVAANNIGYFGPYERTLRGSGHPWTFWQGPTAGTRTIGIESDGSIKPDPSLPSADWIMGNVRNRQLGDIVTTEEFRLQASGSGVTAAAPWGWCGQCQFSRLCRGGDPWIAHVLFGRIGNNPYCYHRARAHARAGEREMVQQVRPAPGRPYDCATWDVVVEALDATWDSHRFGARFDPARVGWGKKWDTSPTEVEWRPPTPVPTAASPSPPDPRRDEAQTTLGSANQLALLRDVLNVKKILDHDEQQALLISSP